MIMMKISALLAPIILKKARPTLVPKKSSPVIFFPPIRTLATCSKLASPQKCSKEEVESAWLDLSKLSVVEDQEIDEETLLGVGGRVCRQNSSSFLTRYLALLFQSCKECSCNINANCVALWRKVKQLKIPVYCPKCRQGHH